MDGTGRGLLLLTESFAVRALLGSLAAAALAGLAVRLGLVRGTRARRLLVLAPVLTAAGAAVASVGEAYLPQLWVATGTESPGQLLDLLGDVRVISPQREIDLLLVGYLVVTGLLVCRRLTGLLAARRILRRSAEPVGFGRVVPIVHRLTQRMGIRLPRVVLVEACPGGAFTLGTWRPVVAVDPLLLEQLDDRELEGLLAHELAHIRRRDTLLTTVVGLFRDLTFFLPPVHVAARWLRGEQEESADEVASAHTKRPAALASSILKVWDCSRGNGRLAGACAVVPGGRLALAGGGTTASGLSGPAAAIAHRVQRLIECRPALPRWRRRAEVGLAGAVTAAAVSAALAVPAWVASEYQTEMVVIGYLSRPPTTTVESPAFATFRALTPEAEAVTGRGHGPTPATSAHSITAELAAPGCPCVESPAQLRDGVPAGTAPANRHMLWRASPDYDPWRIDHVSEGSAARPTRPLLTVGDTDQEMGFFLVGPSSMPSR